MSFKKRKKTQRNDGTQNRFPVYPPEEKPRRFQHFQHVQHVQIYKLRCTINFSLQIYFNPRIVFLTLALQRFLFGQSFYILEQGDQKIVNSFFFFFNG